MNNDHPKFKPFKQSLDIVDFSGEKVLKFVVDEISGFDRYTHHTFGLTEGKIGVFYPLENKTEIYLPVHLNGDDIKYTNQFLAR